jgi:hypothetical protein
LAASSASKQSILQLRYQTFPFDEPFELVVLLGEMHDQILQMSKLFFADRTSSGRLIEVVVRHDFFLEMGTCKVPKHQSGRRPLLTAFGAEEASTV